MSDDGHLHDAVRRAQAGRRGWHGHGVGGTLVLVGSLGVTILAPILLGLWLGGLIDQARGSGAAGRLGLLLGGAGLGLWLAWLTMIRANHRAKGGPPP